jgi:hypothetical protein
VLFYSCQGCLEYIAATTEGCLKQSCRQQLERDQKLEVERCVGLAEKTLGRCDDAKARERRQDKDAEELRRMKGELIRQTKAKV